MPQTSQATKNLISQFQAGEKTSQLNPGVVTIHVDEVASKVAAFYEKIRGVMYWKEEHLLKRGAIERILKRRVLVGIDLLKVESVKESIAEPLVMELIRGGHYPNDKLPETKFTDVQRIIEKYIFILKNTPQTQNGESALYFYNWFLSIGACEIEECLSSSYKERALIDFMFLMMKERIVLNQGNLILRRLKEDEKNIQIYIAVQKALFKLDNPIIAYHILKYQFPSWSSISQEELMRVAKTILQTQKSIERELVHPLANKFYHLCEKQDTPYLLLGDIISVDPNKIEETINNPEILEGSIRDAYEKRVKTLKKRLGRAAIYATLSIFITKVLFALAIEIPIDKALNSFNGLALSLNIIAPPILMFALVATIALPGKSNQQKATMETMKIIHETDKKDSYEIKTFKNGRGTAVGLIIDFFYLITFVFSIGLMVWILDALNFSVLSIIIFILFVSLISFTGTKIRQRSKELHVSDQKEGFISLITDLFAVPFVEIGNWVSTKYQKYNIISALFNILVDMPFMVFVEFIEQWRYFLKEKKEKIH